MTAPRTATLRIDLAGAALAVVAVAGLAALAHVPVASSERHADTLAAEIAEADRAAESLETRAAAIESHRAQLQSAIEASSIDLKPGTSVNAQIARIAAAADAADLQLAQIRPEDGLTLGTHTERPVVLIGSGSFPAVVGFVRELERRFADLGLRSFSISDHQQTPENVSFELELVWFAGRTGA